MVPRRSLLETPPRPGTTKAELNWPRRQPASWGWGGREGSEERSLWVLGRLPPPPRVLPRRLRQSRQNRKRPTPRWRGLRKFPENGKVTAEWWEEGWGGLSWKRVSHLTVSLSFKGNSLAWAQRPSLPVHPASQPSMQPPPDCVPSQFPSTA